MVAWVFFDSFKTGIIDGTDFIDFSVSGDLLKIALVSNSNIPDINVDNFWDDLNATQMASGNGYTTDGETLTTKAVTETGGVTTFNADDVTWSVNGAGFTTARHAILFYDTLTDTTSPLIATLNLGADKSIQAGDFTIEMDALGLITLT